MHFMARLKKIGGLGAEHPQRLNPKKKFIGSHVRYPEGVLHAMSALVFGEEKSPPNQKKVGWGTLVRIAQSECLAGSVGKPRVFLFDPGCFPWPIRTYNASRNEEYSMAEQREMYHGTPGRNVVSIMDQGVMRPDSFNHTVFFSQRLEDVWVHGADSQLRASFGIKVSITVPEGASISRRSPPGNPLAMVVTSAVPIPTRVLELHVRVPSSDGFRFKTVQGTDAIRAYLLQSERVGRATV